MFSTVRRRVAAAGVATVFAATGLMVASIDKAVALSVEGQQSEMHVMGSTVADALSAAGITVGAKDLVVPAADQPISCLLYTSPSLRDRTRSRMPSSA